MPIVSEDELAPCPFCGGFALYERVGSGKASCIVECTSCSCRLETNETFNSGKQWNTRVSIERAMANGSPQEQNT